MPCSVRPSSSRTMPADAGDEVRIGSTVVVDVEGEEERYTIVGAIEAKPAQGLISNESPVGRALLGLRPGEEAVAAGAPRPDAPAGHSHRALAPIEAPPRMDRLTSRLSNASGKRSNEASRPRTAGTTPRIGGRTADPYAACVVRVPADALQPNLAGAAPAAGGAPGVRLHPDHFLHIMLQELGFVVDVPRQPDEISAPRLEEFAQSTSSRSRACAPLPVTLGGANSFQDAVFLDVGGGRSARPGCMSGCSTWRPCPRSVPLLAALHDRPLRRHDAP